MSHKTHASYPGPELPSEPDVPVSQPQVPPPPQDSSTANKAVGQPPTTAAPSHRNGLGGPDAPMSVDNGRVSRVAADIELKSPQGLHGRKKRIDQDIAWQKVWDKKENLRKDYLVSSKWLSSLSMLT